MEQLSTAELSAYIGTPVATLRWWRHEGRGPVSYRLGRRVLYSRADVDAWVAAQKLATARGGDC